MKLSAFRARPKSDRQLRTTRLTRLGHFVTM
jgi:hypothetical protein